MKYDEGAIKYHLEMLLRTVLNVFFVLSALIIAYNASKIVNLHKQELDSLRRDTERVDATSTNVAYYNSAYKRELEAMHSTTKRMAGQVVTGLVFSLIGWWLQFRRIKKLRQSHANEDVDGHIQSPGTA